VENITIILMAHICWYVNRTGVCKENSQQRTGKHRLNQSRWIYASFKEITENR